MLTAEYEKPDITDVGLIDYLHLVIIWYTIKSTSENKFQENSA